MWQRWKIKGSARRYQTNANKRKTDMATLISYKVEFKVKTLYRIESIIAAAKSLQSCPTLCDPIDSSPPGSYRWDSPGKNTGVGCHFLLQRMLSLQLCPTLSDPMDSSPPGFPRQEYWSGLPFLSPKASLCGGKKLN